MKKHSRLVAREEKIEERFAREKIQVERAVNELKLFQAAIQKFLHRREKFIQRHLPHGNVQRRQAELAGERTAARRFDVNDAMREVRFRVKIVGQGEARKFRQLGQDDFRRHFAIQKLPAYLGKFQIRLAGDDVVGQFDYFLTFGFVADFGAAENDFYFRPDFFYRGDDFGRLLDVPNINAEAENFWFAREQGFRDVERTQIDVEFGDDGTRLQLAKIGEEIAQPKRGVAELRVERGEDDVRHCDYTSNFHRATKAEINF